MNPCNINQTPQMPQVAPLKRLHVVVCFAFHRKSGELPCYAIFVAAADVEEAKARGDRMALLLQKHPVEDGWEGHSVDAIAVPDKIVIEAALAMHLRDEELSRTPLVAMPSGFSIQSIVPMDPAFRPEEFNIDPNTLPPAAPLMPPSNLTLEPMSPLRIDDLPRFTGGPQILVGSSAEGKILPVNPLHGAALAAAQSELAEALRDKPNYLGPDLDTAPANQP